MRNIQINNKDIFLKVESENSVTMMRYILLFLLLYIVIMLVCAVIFRILKIGHEVTFVASLVAQKYATLVVAKHFFRKNHRTFKYIEYNKLLYWSLGVVLFVQGLLPGIYLFILYSNYGFSPDFPVAFLVFFVIACLVLLIAIQFSGLNSALRWQYRCALRFKENK